MAYGQGLMLYVFSIYSISRVQAIGDDGLTNFNEKVDWRGVDVTLLQAN